MMIGARVGPLGCGRGGSGHRRGCGGPARCGESVYEVQYGAHCQLHRPLERSHGAGATAPDRGLAEPGNRLVLEAALLRDRHVQDLRHLSARIAPPESRPGAQYEHLRLSRRQRRQTALQLRYDPAEVLLGQLSARRLRDRAPGALAGKRTRERSIGATRRSAGSGRRPCARRAAGGGDDTRARGRRLGPGAGGRRVRARRRGLSGRPRRRRRRRRVHG